MGPQQSDVHRLFSRCSQPAVGFSDAACVPSGFDFEENIVRGKGDPAADDCEVIRQMARAVYFTTCLRPVDPGWNNRGRNVQQYELRVTRLDEQFDSKLKALHETAASKRLSSGTSTGVDCVEYWTAGVLAYFDAGCRSRSPANGPVAVATREALQAYDPGLYALVHETMAYGRPDWRYAPSTFPAQNLTQRATPASEP